MTTVETRLAHEWRIVAPWWHWPLLGGAPAPGPVAGRRSVRGTAPVLQKYDAPDLVNSFLADPQRRLAFVDDTDRVATIGGEPGTLPTRTVAGGQRKLYLASHHRHYLVVASLHCDTAGFPRARRDDVCEAGFVVRRRTADLPGGPDGEAATALRRWAVARRRRDAVRRSLRTAAGPLRRAALERRLAALQATETAARERVRELAAAAGPVRALQGWVPEPDGPSGVGRWVAVEETPPAVTEAVTPLIALVPDPTAPDHDGTGESIWFGIVPTGSSDVEPGGRARFDDECAYEIRCYARRHRPECPRGGGHCSCPVTWSEPTEAYRLAGHFDLAGCANRPVTVQLPDLRQLHADALRLGPGGGVRFRSPPRSELSIDTDQLTATPSPGAMSGDTAQICSFAVPLITIVAFFVLQLFLPIVVFVFQLWFLLALRFCLPPDVTLDQSLIDDFAALGPGLDIDATAAATVRDRPTFATKLTELFGRTRPGGKGLDVELFAAAARQGAGGLDARSLAATGRAALAQGTGPVPATVLAPRVERAEVVQP